MLKSSNYDVHEIESAREENAEEALAEVEVVHL